MINRPTKILITGTTLSGKTTLIQELKKQGGDSILFIDEVAKPVLEKWSMEEVGKDVDHKPDLQDYLFSLQTELEIAAEQSGAKIIVCDRGVPDNVAHSLYYGIPLKQVWLDWCQTYDSVYVLNEQDIPFRITKLQQRIGDRDWAQFRSDLSFFIRKSLQEVCQLPFSVVSGTVEERVTHLRQVFDHLLREEKNFIEGKTHPNKERK